MIKGSYGIADLAADLGLRYKRHTNSYHGHCPVCHYKDSFTLRESTEGRALWHCHANQCDQSVLIGQIKTMKKKYNADDFQYRTNKKQDSESKKWALDILSQTENAKGTLVETYLKSRECCPDIIPPALRYHPGLRHKESKKTFPAMVAKVTREHDGEAFAIHRTFLQPDGSGKADVIPAKKSLGPLSHGGGVYLAPPGEIVGVSEGIESGLSFQLMIGIPTIAALSAYGVRKLILPPLPLARTVYLATDHDPVGLRTAREAALRWKREGRIVHSCLASLEGQDMNDVLRQYLKECRDAAA